MPENGSGNDIDHLQISIEANAAKAAMGIERLALALGTLKTSTSGVSEMLSGIVDSLQKLSQTNNISVKVKAFEKIGTTGANSAKRATTNFSALSRVLSTLAKPFNKAAAAAGNFLKKLGSRVIHAFTGRIERLATGVHRLFNSIRRVVLMRAIRAVLREITAGFKEGIDNLYQWSALVDGRFKASMDKIATSMLYLKNSLAAMVSPIINRLAPAIDWLVDRFVDLLNIVNQVFSALTGSNTWTKAIKYPVEYAEGMADAAKSTKEAAKELKLFLLPFDELNVLTKDNPADTSTPGGAGQGGLNYAEMFETRELEDWAKKIKDLIDQGDWYGAGAALAEHLNGIIEQWDSEAWGKELAAKLNNGIQFALGLMRNFGWELLGDKVGGFLNGFTLDFDWESFGALLATPVNSVSAFLKGMFKRFNGKEFGKGLGRLFNGWVKEMNVQDIIDAFELGVEDATGIIKGFLDTANEEEVAAKIAELLTGVDWDDIMSQVWDVVKTAIGKTWKLGAALVDNLWNGYETDENGNKISNPEKAKYGKGIVLGGATLGAGAVGLSALGGLLKILPAISKIVKFLDSSGILGVLGPAEGAVVGKGSMLVQGLLSNPLSTIGAVGSSVLPYAGAAAGLGIFGVSEANAITKGVNWKNALGNVGGGALAGAGIGTIAGLLGGGPLGAVAGAGIGGQLGVIVTAWTKAIQEIIEHWDQIKEKASEVFDWISEKWGLVTDWISEKWTLVSDWFSEKWTAISTWVDENVIQPVKAVIDPIVEWISTAFEGAWIIVKAAWIIASEWFDEKVIQPIVKLYTDIKEKIVSFLTEAWTRVKAVWAVVSEWFDNKVIQPVIKLYNNVKEKVVGFFTEAWSRVKSTWNVAYQWFNNTIVAPIRRVFDYLGERIREAFGYSWNMVKLEARQVVNALLGFVESGINSIVHVVNQLIGLFNNVVYAAAKVTGDSWTGLTYWQEVHLGRVDWGDENYAAASRGIGGNNEGFGGLADSLRGALFGDDGSSTQNVNVYLDGEQIANNSVKHINRSTVQNGKSPLLA